MSHSTISLDFDPKTTEPAATVKIAPEDLLAVELTVADRAHRNRSKLYQRKHDPTVAKQHGVHTRDRLPELAALNKPIAWHRDRFLARHGWYVGTAPPILAFGIGDLTANLLRPHFDGGIRPGQAEAEGSDDFDPRLFYLEDEPIGEAAYSILLCYDGETGIAFAICHGVTVERDGSLTNRVPHQIRTRLRWWAACPPLLIDGEHDLFQFALLDYDIRHVLGFPKGESEKERFREMHATFRDPKAWRDMIRGELDKRTSYPAIYHGALGITG